VPADRRTNARITWSFRCRMSCQAAGDRHSRSFPEKESLPMALIKPRSRGKRLVRHRTRLDHETNETLYAYARFIGESTEYVLNQVVDTVLARDKEFLQWRTTNRDSYVPGPLANGRRRRVPSRRPFAASPASGDHAGPMSSSTSAQ
jgi:hypothetical protein